MIVHDAERWVYLGVPKTASTALHRYLVEVRGARQIAPQHSMEVPEEYRSWLVFATSLNPFRRAHSLWRMYQSDHRKQARWTRLYDASVVDSFETYVETLFFTDEIRTPLFQMPMTAWLARVPEEVEVSVVPAEAMARGLRRLGILRRRAGVPVVNRTKHPLEPHFTPTMIDAIRTWASSDFRDLGYSTRLEDWPLPASPPRKDLLGRWLGPQPRRFRAGRPCE